MLLFVRIAFLEQVALVGRLHALGQGFVITLEFPAEQQIVAVGHDFIGMVRHFLAGNIHLVFPDLVAVPVELLHDPGRTAEKAEPRLLDFRKDAMAGQRAVSLQLAPKAGIFAFPFIDDFTIVIDQVAGLASLRSKQNITFRYARIIGKHAQRAAKSLIGDCRPGKGRCKNSKAFHNSSRLQVNTSNERTFFTFRARDSSEQGEGPDRELSFVLPSRRRTPGDGAESCPPPCRDAYLISAGLSMAALSHSSYHLGALGKRT